MRDQPNPHDAELRRLKTELDGLLSRQRELADMYLLSLRSTKSVPETLTDFKTLMLGYAEEIDAVRRKIADLFDSAD